jgi:hypothetical protein
LELQHQSLCPTGKGFFSFKSQACLKDLNVKKSLDREAIKGFDYWAAE